MVTVLSKMLITDNLVSNLLLLYYLLGSSSLLPLPMHRRAR